MNQITVCANPNRLKGEISFEERQRQLDEQTAREELEQKKRKSTIDGWKVKLHDKQQQVSELRRIRKIAHDHLNRYQYQEFKRIIRERYGQKVYEEILAEAVEACEAYRVTDTMKHEYTRSNSLSDVTSINKL